MSPRHHVIDPCHGFDQFVCEGWQEKHDLRADQEDAFTGTFMAEDSQQVLRHVLESQYSVDDYNIEIDSSAKRDIFEKLQTAYNACMDEEVIRDLGAAPLLDILRKVEELFPAARPDTDFFSSLKSMDQRYLFSKGENDLSRTSTYLTGIGIDSLISFDVTVGSQMISLFSLRADGFRRTTKIQMSSSLSYLHHASPGFRQKSITKIRS